MAGAALPSGSGSMSAARDGDDKANEVKAAVSGTASHGSTIDMAVAEHSDRAASQADLNSSRPGDSALPQSSGIAMQPAPHVAEAPADHAESKPETAHAGQAPAQAPELPATSAVNTASVIEKMGETEMRVAVHSADFGAISIRASLSPEQMTAQISVDHSDLGKALTSQAPAMEAKLGNELGVRATVEVNQSAMSFSSGGGSSAQSGQRAFDTAPAQSVISPVQLTNNDVPTFDGDSVLYAALASNRNDRLDIRA